MNWKHNLKVFKFAQASKCLTINEFFHSSKLIEFPNLEYRVAFSFLIFLVDYSSSSLIAFCCFFRLSCSFYTKILAWAAEYEISCTWKSEEGISESISYRIFIIIHLHFIHGIVLLIDFFSKLSNSLFILFRLCK